MASADFEVTDWSDRRTTIPPDEGWNDALVDDVVVDEDLSDIRLIRRFTRRRRATRVLGALAVLGALTGGAFVLQQPKVRHEALSFVTMGHPDAAMRLGSRIASVVEALRGR